MWEAEIDSVIERLGNVIVTFVYIKDRGVEADEDGNGGEQRVLDTITFYDAKVSEEKLKEVAREKVALLEEADKKVEEFDSLKNKPLDLTPPPVTEEPVKE